MAVHEEKSCPRCAANFICNPGNITHCNCYEVKLSANLVQHLSETFGDCVCNKCLYELQKDFSIQDDL